MGENKKIRIKNQLNLICQECGVGNLKGTENCLFCSEKLNDTIVLLEDDSFDLEITKDAIVEYRKSF